MYFAINDQLTLEIFVKKKHKNILNIMKSIW